MDTQKDIKEGLSELAQEVKVLANQRDVLLEACKEALKLIEIDVTEARPEAIASIQMARNSLRQAINQSK